MMNIKPAPNLIFVTEVKPTSIPSKSGLYSADKSTKKTLSGRIAHIGETDGSLSYIQGQEIIFIEGAGQGISISGQDYTLIRVGDVVATI